MSIALEDLLKEIQDRNAGIGIIGLGYVGLPLAVEFGKRYRTLGFDIKPERIDALNQGRDVTREVEPEALKAAEYLTFTANPEDLAQCSVYIVTVPTPIDSAKRPDLGPLIRASECVGRYLSPGNVVIYESTVYPGATEEECVPILERESGLRYRHSNVPAADERVACASPPCQAPGLGPIEFDDTPEKHFYCGYSPERINPGDQQHRLPDITKITSGSTPEAAEFVDQLYASIVTAGTHRARSIRVAEAAKVIENVQRDVNIALVNELAMLFNKLDIDTSEVLAAAGTKWNFLPFKPGMVGGHCIGVDPYYLTHKAQQIGFHPEMILAGRRTNDGMSQHIAGEVIKLMAKNGVYRAGARVLILGLAFKENCPDLRNTKVVDVINSLKGYHLNIDLHDPWVDPEEATAVYGLSLLQDPQPDTYDAVVLAVAHREFMELRNPGIRKFCRDGAIVYDVKGVLPDHLIDGRL